MPKEWDGVERRKQWGAEYPNNGRECLIDPECFYRVKQQVEINTKKIDIIEVELKDIEVELKEFITAKLIAEGAVKGSKATLVAAGMLVITSVALVITLFLAVINGKLSFSEFFKIVF